MSSWLRTAALLVPALIVLASCSLAPDHCIAMSDCDDTATCVEGRCEPNSPAPDPQLLSTTDDGGAPPVTSTDDGSVPASASQPVDTTDAADAALTDSATD